MKATTEKRTAKTAVKNSTFGHFNTFGSFGGCGTCKHCKKLDNGKTYCFALMERGVKEIQPNFHCSNGRYKSIYQ